IPACRELGVGNVVFSPLAQGVLTGKYHPGQAPPPGTRAADNRVNTFMQNRGLMLNDTLLLVEKLAMLAKQVDLTMAQLALACCLRLPEVSSVIIGATRTSQIDANVRAAGVILHSALLKQIDDLTLVEVQADTLG